MIVSGFITGFICAIIVAVIGVTFVSNSGSGLAKHIGEMWRFFLRSVLGVVSIVVLGVVGTFSLVTGTTESLQFFVSFAATYLIGVTVYFVARYGFSKRT